MTRTEPVEVDEPDEPAARRDTRPAAPVRALGDHGPRLGLDPVERVVTRHTLP